MTNDSADSAMPPDIVARYLGLLDVERKAPSEAALGELVRAHLCHVPFENLSKLHYSRRLGLRSLPKLGLFLDGIERYNFGGTCYANNYYLYLLLRRLGYAVTLCGADMTNPDVHLVSMVEVNGRQYLVDAGYGAPFLAPLPRDLRTCHEIRLGNERYRLEPQDARGRSRLRMFRDGKPVHGYLAKPEPRRIDEFERVIADSYRTEATFMNAIVMARFFRDGRSVTVHNLSVVESRGTTAIERTLAGRGELVEAIVGWFGTPRQITRDVVSSVALEGDAWG